MLKCVIKGLLAATLALALAGCVRNGPGDVSGLSAGAGAVPAMRGAVSGKFSNADAGSKALSSAGSAASTCVTVRDSATTVGEDRTRRIAEAGLASSLEQRRGELIASGLRRLVISPTKTNCTAYLNLGAGMQEFICEARAQICGSSGGRVASAGPAKKTL